MPKHKRRTSSVTRTKTKESRTKARRTPLRSDARDRALHAISLMRRRGLSLRKAASEAGTSPSTIRHYLPAVFLPRKSGQRVRVTKGDSYAREMLFISALGDVPFVVHSSKAASLLARHRSAVGKYLSTGDESVLEPFQGKTIEGKTLLTDPGTLSALVDAGVISPREFYAGGAV